MHAVFDFRKVLQRRLNFAPVTVRLLREVVQLQFANVPFLQRCLLNPKRLRPMTKNLAERAKEKPLQFYRRQELAHLFLQQ